MAPLALDEMKTRTPRLLWLDVLRALAVSMVVVHHTPFSPFGMPQSWYPYLKPFLNAGWVGVDLFFVLSGFLISDLVFKEIVNHGTFSLKRFYIRRSFRILPPLWALLAATATINVLSQRFTLQQFLFEVFFLQNYTVSVWIANWSLAVEEHFYLLFGAFVWWTVRRKRQDAMKLIPLLTGVVLVVSLACRIQRWNSEPFQFFTHFRATQFRMDSLMVGVLLAYLWRVRRERVNAFIDRFKPWLWSGTSVVLLAPVFCLRDEHPGLLMTVGFPLLAFASAFLIVSALRYEAARTTGTVPPARFATRALGYVGEHSYSIYLWHSFLLDYPGLIYRYFTRQPPPQQWNSLSYWILSLVVGIGMAKIVEIPAIRLRDRLFPRAGISSVPDKQGKAA